MTRANTIALVVAALASACSTRTGNLPPIPEHDAGATDAPHDGGSIARDGRCEPTGTTMPPDDEGCTPPLGMPPPLPRDCAPGTEWIYLVTRGVSVDREGPASFLLRYEPTTNTLAEVGEIGCSDIAPFSMAVDRAGTAWILSARGGSGIYRVSTEDASCERTAYIANQNGWEEFGMGFAADGLDSTTEQLYVIGGPRALIHDIGAEVLFGALDTTTLEIETRGRIRSGVAELSGTGEGDLWGLFSHPTSSVQRVDKLTGERSTSYPVPEVGEIFARAMAFWGGDFYLFVAGSLETPSRVYRLETVTGRVTLLIENAGHVIVGAGVSTCAPYELI